MWLCMRADWKQHGYTEETEENSKRSEVLVQGHSPKQNATKLGVRAAATSALRPDLPAASASKGEVPDFTPHIYGSQR
jgi:hypothetical protein